MGLHLSLGSTLLLCELVVLPLLVLAGADDLVSAIHIHGLGPLELASGVADVLAQVLDLFILWIVLLLLLDLAIVQLSLLSTLADLCLSNSRD